MPASRFRLSSISCVLCVGSLTLLSACGGGGGSSTIAASPTASSVVGVQSGVAIATLSDKADRSISNARVGLVAYATGIDTGRGQIVAVTGIAANPNVGAPVPGGVVTYNTQYNYQVSDNVSRTENFISGQRATRRTNGAVTLTADFGAGTLEGQTSDLTVGGQINGQSVSGNVQVRYDLDPIVGPDLRGTVNTSLNGQIDDNGVIATFHGSDNNTALAGGLVGTAN